MSRRRTSGDPSRATAVSVAVRVKPGAGRTRVGGRYDGPHGPALIVAVSAPAVDGKATEAVRRALAQAFGVRPADVVLRVGATSRDKVYVIETGRSGTATGARVASERAGRGGSERDRACPSATEGPTIADKLRLLRDGETIDDNVTGESKPVPPTTGRSSGPAPAQRHRNAAPA